MPWFRASGSPRLANADVQVLSELIADHGLAQQRSDRFCVTLIDDADALEPRALECLVSLCASSPMRLVLFGEVRLVPALERLAEPAGVEWHEIRLTGFGAEEARAYLEWHLRQQGYADELPFSEAEIKEITRLSEGLPGRINKMARVLLARIESTGEGPARRPFPALHTALLAALIAVLGGLYLWWQPTESGGDRQPVRVETVAVPAPRPIQSADSAATDPQQQEQIAPPAQMTEAEPETAKPAAEVPVAGDGANEEPATEDPATNETPAAEPVTEAPAAEQAATPDQSATGNQPDEPAASDGVRDAAWIMGQPAARYTLQLASFSTAERAEAYTAGQNRPGEFARYRLQRDGGILHVVIFGSFEDRAAAEAAARDLPAEVGNVQPWIRTFGQVQEAVRTALQS
ncbi:MAG: SPOR domain-containing protein [Gammaproteobacteria bacterium]|nr:SPOR domain-containing protein [Gammaproteobacteria bacterium]